MTIHIVFLAKTRAHNLDANYIVHMYIHVVFTHILYTYEASLSLEHMSSWEIGFKIGVTDTVNDVWRY